MKHTEEEWGTWGKVVPLKQCSIAAIDTRTKRLVVLPPDGADAPLPCDPGQETARIRARRGELLCPVEGCGAYETTCRNPKGRDHFRHHKCTSKRPGHDPESLEHQSAKYVLADWISTQLAGLITRLEVDEYPITCLDGSVVEPDVYVALDNGTRIAVEYQASPGDVITIEHKQRAYDSSAISVWWIFGPSPRTCRVIDRHDTKPEYQMRLLPTQQQLISMPNRFYWFAASEERLGTPLSYKRWTISPQGEELWQGLEPRTRTYAVSPYLIRTQPEKNTVWLRDGALGECSIDSETGKLISPGLRYLRAQQEAAQREVLSLRQLAHNRFLAQQPAQATPAAVPSPPLASEPSPVCAPEKSAQPERMLVVPPSPREQMLRTPTPDESDLPSRLPAQILTNIEPQVPDTWWRRLRRFFVGW